MTDDERATTLAPIGPPLRVIGGHEWDPKSFVVMADRHGAGLFHANRALVVEWYARLSTASTYRRLQILGLS